MAKNKKPDKKFKASTELESVEPRLLFSAGLEGVLAEQMEAPTDNYNPSVIEQNVDSAPNAATDAAAADVRVELIFVDQDTPEYQALLSDLMTYPDESTRYQVFELDNTQDGIAQITATLSGYENVNAVHILSHGSQGAIDLGGGVLDNNALAANADLVGSWGSALTDAADILIYGCDLAATAEGQMLVNTLATLTGADVAASDDLTGSAQLGGDWELEYQRGDIDTASAFDADNTQAWSGVLAAPVNTVPATQATDEDSSLVLSSGNGNAVSVSDADSTTTEVTLTVTNGTVTLTNTIGPEFQANTTTADAQTEPVIAIAADDSYVVAWTSKGQDDLDNKKGVYFQRYAADGTAQGIETLANQTTLEDQDTPAIAMDAAGNFVITWVSKGQDNVDNSDGVYARAFNADGTAATNEFLVTQTTLEDQAAPAVSMDNAGNFVIAWQSKGQDNVDGHEGVYARLFNAAGTPTTGEFLVNQTTLKEQRAPGVAMDADGDFVVAWQSKDQDGNNEGIYARQFDAAGVAQTNEFLVNQTTSNEQKAPSVATDDAGNFVIAWQSKDQDFVDGKKGIIARLYDSAATAQGNEFVVNSTLAGDQEAPVVAMNGAGEFVVSWESRNQDDPDGKRGIFAQYYDATGTAQGSEFLVNQTTPLDQKAPSAVLNSSGEAIAAWQSKDQDGDNNGIYGQRFLPPEVLTFITGDGVNDNLVTFNGDLDYVNDALDGMVFTPTADFHGTANIQIDSDDGTETDTDAFDITVNPVNDAPAHSIPGPQTTVESTALTFSTGNGNAISITDDAGLNPVEVTLEATYGSISLGGVTGLTFTTGNGSDDPTMVFTGTLADINTALEGTTFTPLAGFAGNAYLRITTDDQGNTGGGVLTDTDTISISVTPDAINDAPVNSLPPAQATPQDTTLVFSDSNGNPVTISDDADGSPVQLTLTVTNGTLTLSPEIQAETLVNTNTVDDQLNSQVAAAADGSYIVVWEGKAQDDPDGKAGIFAQRYNPLGEAEGPEFQVNTFTAGDQKEAAVAMNADGSFVVVWQSANQDGDGTGIYGQLFDTGGNRVGGEFEINTTIANNQDTPAVAMDNAGNFVVSWASKGQDNLDLKAGIYAQRFDAAGLALGDEFLVNTETLQDQKAPAIAMDSDGDFVIVWQSMDQDDIDGKNGIYAQRYDASGNAQGLEFLVNTETLNDQLAPAVAMDAAGNFVVAWQSKDQDDIDGKTGVYAQRFAANGATQGIEFLVNTTTLEDQTAPGIAMQDSGEFIITWQSKGQDDVDGKNGIYAQRYDASGAAEGIETLVNTTTLEDQQLPAVVLDGDGNAIVSWTSKAQDDVDGKNGVYLQRLAHADAITYITGDGVDDASIELTGTIKHINELLDGMVFTPTAAFNGTAGIQVDVDDLGNTGSGGALTDSDSVYITVGTGDVTAPFQVNNTGSNLLEGGSSIISNAQLRYDDAGQPSSAVTYTVTSAPANGQLELSTNPGVAISSFTQAQIDSGQVVYKHNDSETVTDSFGFDVDDGSFNVLTGQSFSLAITPVNDAPVNNVPGQQNTDTDTAIVFDAVNGNLISLSDDAGNSAVELTLTATNGLVSLSGTTGLIFSVGDGSDDLSMTFTGTLTDINAALDGLAFDPDALFTGTATLQLVTDDLGNTGGGALGDTDTINIEVGNYNEAPVLTVPDAQGMIEDGSLVFSTGNGNLISVADADAAGNDIEVKLAVGKGTLTLNPAGVPALIFSEGSGTADPMMIFRGTVAEINSALEGLTFDPVANYAGQALLQVTVNDLGNTGPGGALVDAAMVTINITPDATDEAPTLNMPGPQVTSEDVPLTIGSSTGIPVLINDDSATQIFDDSVSTPVEVTITASGGTISLSDATGNEFAINTHITDDQTAPAVASAANGDYVVVWASNNQDGNGDGVYGQRFSVEGLALGGEFRINAGIVGDQTDPVVAMADDGSFVVAWSGVDADGMGVFGQRFSATGATVGGEFQVNSETLEDQARPALAMDDAGNFVVVWQSDDQDGNKLGIYGQRFDNTGLALGSEFQVNTETLHDQQTPAVAMDADGDFVVVWNSFQQDGSNAGIYGQRFDAGGAAQGSEFQVNTRINKDQSTPTVAMDDAGNFVVAWQSQQQDDLDKRFGIYSQRFDAAGGTLGAETLVNTTTARDQTEPGISMDGSGEYVIVWQSDDQDGSQEGIYGQRFAADGSTIHSEFLINSTTTSAQTAAAVAMSESDTFVSVWSSLNQDGDKNGIYGQRFDTDRNVSFTSGDGVDDVVMTFSATVAEINDLLNGLVFTPDPEYGGAASISIDLDDGTNTTSDSTSITVLPINDAPTVTVPGSQSVAEGQLLVFSTAGGNAVTLGDIDAGPTQLSTTLTASGGTLSLDGLTGLSFTTGTGSDDAVMTFTGTLDDINAALDGMRFSPEAGYTGSPTILVHVDDQGNTGAGGALTADDTIYVTITPDLVNDAPVNSIPGPQVTAKNEPLVFSSDNGNGVSITDDSGTKEIELTLTVTNGSVSLSNGVGVESLVNTTTNKAQMASQVAVAPNGEYVVVWQSDDQDGQGNGIFAQRFNSHGQAEGAEFQLNTTTANDQTVPVIAMDASGNFAVAWQSDKQDGDNQGIVVRSFDVNGSPLTDELLVNSMAVNNQVSPAIAMADDGRFVVVWQSTGQDGSGEGVYGQLYSADGSVFGDEFLINTYTTGNQAAPAVAMNASGDFVVAWQSSGQDLGGEGIYAQRFDATGATVDSEFRINNTTAKDQAAPAVALRDDGSFVVVWQSDDQDGDKNGIYGQAYDNAGVQVGAEFLVNTTTHDEQRAPQISLDDEGDYVVVWQSHNQDGNGEGVYGQVFDADGTLIGEEFRINTETNEHQTAPAVAAYGTGNFVTTWTSRNQDGNNEGVYAQRFLDPQGLNFITGDGTDDALIVVRGTLEQINAVLDGMEFTPDNNFEGAASIRMQVDDLGSDGYGGAQTDDDTIDIVVGKAPLIDLDADDSSGASGSAYQTAFYWTGASAPVLVADSDSFFSDPDDTKLESLTVTLTNRPDGAAETLTADTSGTSLVLTAYNPATGELVLTGSELIAEYEQVLRTIAYDNVAADPDESQRMITFVANDGSLDGNVATTYLTVFGPNDAPVATVPGAQATLEDTTLVFSAGNGNAITVSDEDAAGSDIQVTLSSTGGDLTLGSTQRLASVVGNGTGTVVLTGTVNVINAVLDGLQFDPAANFHGGTSIDILVEDLGNTGVGGPLSDSESIAINVTSVNDEPDGANKTVTTLEDTDYSFTVSDFGFSDTSDSPANAMTGVVITTVPGDGTLYLDANSDGVVDGGEALSATDTVALADISAGLLKFKPAEHANGAAYSSFTFQVQDDGGVANGGVNTDQDANTITIDVTAVNDDPTGSPAITGTVTEDQSLTADTSGISDADGLGTFSFQWQRDGSDISGATSSTYVLGDDDVGATITVVASYTDGDGTGESLTSAGVGPVANVNDAPTGNVTVSGTPTEDQTLTASNTLADADGLGTISYQWQRDGSDISGATASTYVLGDADVGATITVVASYTDGHGTAESVSSGGVGPIANINDAPTGSVTISGTPTEDETLTASNTLADDDGLGTISYQWQRDGSDISGATASTYVLDDADVGATITVVASYTDGQGTAESVSSGGVGPIANVNDAPTGSVTISGTPTEDETLTASNTLADADGLGTISYQWQRDGSDIVGATASTYVLDDADVGTTITVVASYTDGEGTNESVTSTGAGPVANVNDAPTGSVSISGTPTEDETLTASNTLADADGMGTISYQWQRDGSDISGATASTYVLGDADVGATITVVASYTDGEGTAESVSSSGVGPIANVNDAPTGNVTISGTPTEDQGLSAGNTLADADGIGTISYQWQRDGADISGATAATYTLGDADVGATITVVASYTDGHGTAESVSSGGVGPITNVNDAPTGSVTISGTPAEDQTLTASNTLADDDGMGTISYQWQRDGSDISGATASTYVLDDADVGATITVVASYTDGEGTAESVTSGSVGPIANVNDTPTGSVTISGTPTEDETLTASNTLADDDGLGAISYQWQRDGSDISGATGSTYTLDDDDVGASITAVASYTDGEGTNESVSSGGVGPVANVNDAPTGSVTISGTPTEDETLTASNTLADDDGLGTISYQWQRDGSDISGATAATYVLGDADVGATITVIASYTDGEGTAESVSSGSVGPVANVNDAPTGSVTISGTPTEDETLTASNSLADADGLGTITYQWQRDGSDISGATAATYVLGDADVGATITVIASYTDGEGTAESVTSGSVGPIANINDAPTGTVSISGTPTEDETLTASNSLADDDGLGTISYQWQRDGSDISGATAATYVLGDADVGATITVIASYTDGEGTAESVTSGSVGPIANINDAPTGSVTISGTPTEDETLTASNSLADADGLGAISYQWQRDGSDISGATATTYVLGDADVGATITVIASYTDGEGTAESVTSGSVGPIANINDAPTGTVSISGTPTEDETLTASNTLADADGLGTITYQWQRDGSDISGATAATYVLGDADVGATITVVASYSDGEGTAESMTSGNVGPIANINDAPTGSVTISGTPTEDETLIASNSLADADGLGTITYQWQRDGSDIAGATASTYVLDDADVGATITVIASYTDGEGTAESVTSGSVGPIANVNDAPTGSVTISGTPTEDETLTASNTLADADGLGTITYQWQRDGSDISGATSATFVLGDADVGATITVVASYTDGEGTAESVTSGSVGPISNVNDAPTGSVTISGTPTEDETLTASNTLADADGLGTISYQWQRDGSDISGATAATYVLGDADVGATITVIASYTDGEGTAESVTSGSVGPIANVNDAPSGSVTISGTPTEDETLTASNSLADADGLGTISYQWQRDGSDISGATAATYVLGDADVGATITVIASYTDGEGTAESVTSGSVGPIANVNDAPSGSVTISGTPTEDETLTASNTLADADGLGTITYQWQRDGSDISGATAATYVLGDADVGAAITVIASYTDGEGTAESVTSGSVGPIANVNDAPTGGVSISGTPTEDETLTASNTLADDDGMGTITYQWQRDGSDISGATAATYVLDDADVGATITVIASYTDSNGTAESVTSGSVGPIANINDAPTGSVTISGITAEAETLTASNTLADDDGLGTISYQWQRDGADIGGATASTYVLTNDDVGATITVIASYTDGHGASESVTSAGVGPITNVNNAPTGSVTISGTPTEDETLTASNTLADDDGLGTITYQWQRDGSDISGATASTYVLGDADVGASITVIARYTDGNGTPESVTSSAVGPIANVNDTPTGSVNISGTSTEDEDLTASNTLADADGLGTISYQWQRDGADISGATGVTYTLDDADVGATITVIASYTDGEGTAESVSSSSIGPIANVNDAPTGSVTISGTPTEDETLTASNTLADADGLGTISYQWQRDGSDISGATAATYVLGDADVGATITVIASYTDGEGTAESVTSGSVGPIANVNDAPTGSVTISGTPTEDETLTASNTLADADGLGTISYQWQRDGADIGGATSATYTLDDADVGANITAIASYTDGEGTAESVASSGVGPIANVNDAPTGSVTISGTPSEDETLTVSNTLADADGLGTITYQWQRDGSDVSGATATTYVLGDADVGATITVIASYTDGEGTAESVTSGSVGPISNVNDAPTGSVTISGTPTEDETLTASNTLADADGLGTISYQWQRDGSDIVGATASTYVLDDADVGATITVIASYTDGEGTAESVTSGSVGPIANINDAPTGSVTISGTPTEDETLTAANTLTDDDGLGAITYQWQRDGSDIVGATASTYVLDDADVGATITVVASYTDGEGTAESVTSGSVGPIANVNDAPTGSVTISGTAAEDQTLTASNTLADADGLGAITYQWQRDGSDIGGATASTYVLGDADVGATITVIASYTDGEGTAESVTSGSVGPIANVNDAPTGGVSISGTPTEDETLTASNTLADADGLGTITYQWQRDGSDISGATAATYVLGDADVGSTISVVASYTDGEGTNESVTSAGVGPIANVNDAPTGSVSISGTAAEDQTLTASNSLADADGLGTISYQWQRDGSDIVGATASTYVLDDADVGATITVVASYTDGEGTAESVTSGSVGPIANVNDAPTGSVTISGTAAEDQTLTASNTLADADGLGAITYQWQRDGSDISGATGVSYTLGDADVGATITVIASYTDGEGTAESVTSGSVGPIANVNDAPTGSVSVSGTPTEDETLTASNTLADADGLGTISYQWQRDGSDISGATASTYVLGDADVGATITVVASYTDGNGTPESVTSSAVGPIANVNDAPTGTVGISGTPTEDQTLTASNTLADADGLGTITYQWQRDGSDISGATAATYVLGDADVGATITVIASYTDGEGTNESVTSAGVGPIANVNDAPTGSVSISGTAAEDQTLTASNTLADADGLGTISYQWQRDGSDISGATAATYVLGDADVGASITVVASYTDGEGTAESVTSGSVGPIANVNDAPTGSVTISGTPAEDQTLTASNTLADADGLGAITYQWQRDGSDISGATGVSYTLGDADVGATITVVASYTDGEGTAESVTSGSVGPISNVNDAPTGTVSISGTPVEDQMLSASNSLADTDGLGAITYQWQRDGSDISGATASTYVLGDADVGATITVVASYTDGEGTNESVVSAGVGPISNINDAPTGTVSISGTPAEDETLTASNTLADADGLGAIGYQWQRDGSDISGATAATYVLGDADVGATITVVASYTDGEGTNESVTSGSVGPVSNVNDAPAGLPVVNGMAVENQLLTADTSGISDADGVGAFAYQWLRGGVDISGATASTYVPDDADVGTQLSVRVSFTDAHGNPEGPFTSAQTATITNVNDAPSGGVYIDNTSPTAGETLTASNSLTDADGLSGAISYQWFRDGVAISGANSPTYSMTNADAGAVITVVASYTDDQGSVESVRSDGTDVVFASEGSDHGTGTGGGGSSVGGDPDDEEESIDKVEKEDSAAGVNRVAGIDLDDGTDKKSGMYGVDAYGYDDYDRELYGEKSGSTGFLKFAVTPIVQAGTEITEEMLQLFDLVRIKISEVDDQSVGSFLKSASTVTMTFSVGIVSWLLRGGSIVASMLSSVSVMKGLDPMPVIKGHAKAGKGKSGRSDEKDAQVDDMFDGDHEDQETNAGQAGTGKS